MLRVSPVPKSPPRARAEVVIAVNDESYRSSLTDRILSSGTPRFAEIPNGLIAEETVAAAVSYAGVRRRRSNNNLLLPVTIYVLVLHQYQCSVVLLLIFANSGHLLPRVDLRLTQTLAE